MTPDLDIPDIPFSQCHFLTQEQRASRRVLDAMHPGNRFRLMAGMPLLPEVKIEATFDEHTCQPSPPIP